MASGEMRGKDLSIDQLSLKLNDQRLILLKISTGKGNSLLTAALKRTVRMNLKNIAATAVMLATSYSTASAATVTVVVLGTSYNVTTFDGTFDGNESLLKTQPWWGDAALAQEFASIVGYSLGANTSDPDVGPFFAYSNQGQFIPVLYSHFVPAINRAGGGADFESLFSTYARVSTPTAVPLPASGLLLLAGLGGGLAVKRRKKIRRHSELG